MSRPSGQPLAELAEGISLAAAPTFKPPPRFGKASFESYRPGHPSQEQALTRIRQLVGSLQEPTPRRGFLRLSAARRQEGRGLYLDGGFGVGKTHLLAAAWHAARVDAKAYLSFQELVYLVGVRGIVNAAADFAGLRLLCLDEFELDDPGNTLIVKSVLQQLFEQGSTVITTSNTPASAQGEGRFNARDFEREIQGIASRFESIRLDGADWRESFGRAAPELHGHVTATGLAEPQVVADWQELLAVLRKLHPVAYGTLLTRIGSLTVNGVDTIANQNDALRFVHFIDRLYDLRVQLRLGVTPRLQADLHELFDASYRQSAYQKKHDRCLSRITELLVESAGTQVLESASAA